MILNKLQVGDGGVFGSVVEDRVGEYVAPTLTSTTGVNPTNHYAFGRRMIPTLRGAANDAWLVGCEVQPTFDDTGTHTGMEAAADYISAYLKPSVHLDFLALSMIDEISRDTGASVTNLYGLYIQPMVGATSKNIAIKTIEGDVPAKHELGGNVDIQAHFAGGVSFNITDLTSGQGAYFSNGSCLNFDNATNGLGQGIINHRGYAQGTTQPRDLYIRDGMGSDIAQFKAADLSLTVVGKFGCNSKAAQGPYSSGGSLGGVVTALINCGILAN